MKVTRIPFPVLTAGLVLWMIPGSPERGAQFQHNPGTVCSACHEDILAGGTVYTDSGGARGQEGVGITLIGEDGVETPLGVTNGSGNLASGSAPSGRFLVRMAGVTSRTWHALPAQGMCNSCHLPGGNGSTVRTRRFPELHTGIPADNSCAHCHHFPASMSYAALATEGVLAVSAAPPVLPVSRVEILGQVYPFEPAAHAIASARPDVFAPGYYSMFDVILAVAAANGIAVEHHYDAARKTHFIDRINGTAADYWYHFSYDAGSGNTQEIGFRRANRWDELLWRPGAWVRVVSGENLEEIKSEYLEEIRREESAGHVIPSVQISANAAVYQGNPLGSGRVRGVQRRFTDVQVTAHNSRSLGFPSPYSRPFRPGVVTALDVLLSLQDQGHLDVVSTVHYSNFAQHYIDSQYVVAIGFPGVGTAHSSGTHGWIYVTENGASGRLPNGAAGTLHVTSDILVIHAPDFATWQWRDGIGPGLPYYEAAEPAGDLPGAGDRLCLPLPEEGSGLQAGVAVVNEGAVAAAANWIARTDAGAAMAIGAPGVNPARTVIPKRGQLAGLIPELFGGPPAAGGWLEMLGDEPGMSGFFLIFDPAVNLLDGADLSGRRSSRFFVPEIPSGQQADVVLVNTGSTQAADVILRLRDDRGVQQGSPVQRAIPALARQSIAIRDLFSDPSGYLQIVSSVPLAAIARFGLPGAHVSMLNTIDAGGRARLLYAPQFIQGAGYRSTLAVVNLEDVPTRVTLAWTGSDGLPIGSPVQADLPGLGRILVSDPAAFGATPGPEGLQGYVTATSSSARIAGSVRFGDPAGERFQTALPLVTGGLTDALFGQVADDPVHWYTGLAAVNPNTVPVRLEVQVFNPDASGTWTGEVPIPAGGRISALLSQLVPGLPPMGRGYFRVRADRPIVNFAVFGPRSLASLAAIPPAPAAGGR